jgi:hypothetical protein
VNESSLPNKCYDFTLISANWPSWLSSPATTDWAVAFGTLVLAFVAVFQQWLQGFVVRPKLRLAAHVARPDAEKTRWSLQFKDPQGNLTQIEVPDADVYYFRLAITNKGNTAAHDVQVFLAGIERVSGKKLEEVDGFSPMNLKWAHLNAPTRPVLLPDMPPVYCDMAHVCNPKVKKRFQQELPGVEPEEPTLGLDVEVIPASRGDVLPPGTYHFTLKLAASNCPVRTYVLEIIFPGRWFDDQDTMFNIGFKMGIIKEYSQLRRSFFRWYLPPDIKE